MDWPETRLRTQLWLFQSWPFRVIAWLRLRSRPARDPSLQDVIAYLQGEIARIEAAEAAIKLDAKVSNITMGKSGSLAVTTLEATRALIWQDVAQGHLERPDVAINLETNMTISTTERYFEFLGTEFIAEDGTRKQPAKGRYIDHLREIHEAYRPKYDLTACLAGTQQGFAGRVWFWSDLHFFHSNIIKYVNRPFATASEMNKALLSNCLARVTADDILVIGGDITMGNIEATNALLRAIPAYKINVLGNHDYHRNTLLRLDVDETAACIEIVHAGQAIFLSHYPVSERVLSPAQINLHGHIHNDTFPTALGSGRRHINMCVECTGYAPMLLPELLLHLETK